MVFALRFVTFAFLLHLVRIPCALLFSFLRFGVVGLFGRVSFVTGCFVSCFARVLTVFCVFCGLGVSCWGRVKDFGMGTLVVRGFLSVVIV